MRTKPITWSVDDAYRLWHADVPLRRMMEILHVDAASIMYQVHTRGWHERASSRPRPFPCVECKTPMSAVRKDTRCPMCGLEQRHRRNNRSRHCELAPKPERKVIVKSTVDFDILCYRAHRDRVMDERNAILQSAKEALAA